MLFLGAGASKAVGIGHIQDLTQRIKERLSNSEYREIWEHIETVLESANTNNRFFNLGEIDLEVIFSVLKARAHHINALKDLGSYAIYLDQLRNGEELPLEDIFSDPAIISGIKDIIDDTLVQSCSAPNIALAQRYYRDLFEFEKTQLKRGSIKLFAHVVTTNYDLVFERCARDIQDMPWRTGFTPEPKSDEQILPIEDIRFQNNGGNIQYVKLHGSINWWIRKRDRQVVRRDSPNSLSSETYEHFMVYPIYEKYVSQDPTIFALYDYFRDILQYHDIYIVIGYSFRDPAINNAFKQGLDYNANKRLIIINPNPDLVKARIRTMFPNEKIDVIECKFGDDSLYSNLHDVLNSRPFGI